MTTIFDVKNMSYEVNGKKILKDISFTVEKGEFLTIKGPSGSGKSTLLECLASLISPSSGEIYYKGKPLSAFDVTDYRKEVSYGFQNASLFGETVAENLAFPYLIRDQEFDRKRALELLKKVNLSESYLEQKVTALSGGEKQRIAFIRNVVFMPEVLLLDEVTSSLDEATRHDIGEAIRRFNQEEGVTVLWVTHNTEEIKNATKTMEIVAGQVEVDTHA
ncbi:ATP-binding cassette domain-containing protein [Jeotgalibaca dankookensis]|uniref:ABC transporter ATP-binding protein n=1 Tax=Jeotgalibaca dankookensis TaxID=708126 RepID=UPI0009E1CA6E